MKNKILFIDNKNNLSSESLNNSDLECEVVSPEEKLEESFSKHWDLIFINSSISKSPFYLIKLLKKNHNNNCTPVIVHSSNYSRITEIKSQINEAEAYISSNEINTNFIKAFLNSETTHCYDNDIEISEHNKKSKFSYNRMIINEQMLSLLLAGKDIDSTAFKILDLLSLVCSSDIAILIVNFRETSKAYIKCSKEVDKNIFSDFFKFCQHDHYSEFTHIDISSIQKMFSDNSENDTLKKINYDGKLINSYLSLSLRSGLNNANSTLHIGNFSNNYFANENITNELDFFCKKAGVIIDTINKISFAEQDRKDVKNLFSKFIPAEIIDDIIREGSTRQKNERKNITVLFSDIRSFTTITEENEADNVISFLNIYFDEMVQCIKKYGGTIDKFIGDAIVAVFGIYDDKGNSAENAVKAAEEMILHQRKLQVDNIKLPPIGFGIGIGIHYGESIVGNIGSDEKMAYTIVGKISGIAEELEGMTKNTAAILFSEDVQKQLKEKKAEAVSIPIDEDIDFEVYTLQSEIDHLESQKEAANG